MRCRVPSPRRLLLIIVINLDHGIGRIIPIDLYLHQFFNGNLHFHSLYHFILFFASLGLDPLPGQPSFEEVDQNEAEALQVVTTALLDTDVGVETRVSSGACERFAVFVGNVLAGFWIPVLLGKAEVDDVDVMLAFAKAHQKVIRFDIPMQI